MQVFSNCYLESDPLTRVLSWLCSVAYSCCCWSSIFSFLLFPVCLALFCMWNQIYMDWTRKIPRLTCSFTWSIAAVYHTCLVYLQLWGKTKDTKARLSSEEWEIGRQRQRKDKFRPEWGARTADWVFLGFFKPCSRRQKKQKVHKTLNSVILCLGC